MATRALTSEFAARGFIASTGTVDAASNGTLINAVRVSLPQLWDRFFRNAHIKADKALALLELARHLGLMEGAPAEPVQRIRGRTRDAKKVVRAARKARIAFYESDEWRAIRYEALKREGGACRCCGRTAKDGVTLHVDHIKPRSLYPHLELALDNLQVLCRDCNLGKSNKDTIDWRPRLVVSNKVA